MKEVGLRKGQHGQVRIEIGGEELALLTFTIITENEVRADVYIDDDDDLVSIVEVLEMGVNAVKWKLESPKLKKLVRRRIEELRAMAEEEEDKPPYPTDIADIPF